MVLHRVLVQQHMVLQAEVTFVIIKIDIFGYHKKPDNRFLTKRGVTELVGSIVGDSILQVILHFLSVNTNVSQVATVF
jgi:hypothetical protein